ncbi:heavy metal-binding domain-containing protein [Legionella sp. km772]|uniref:heavy metal-binding domain-containing protein n=1 Tax=Legionella sp. km772 TaxID=2498111 RepID=UPI000F8F2D0C|nr:heavy metal-binding domain-containing protein [Legionella sp. km772]RUR12459.1 heavy metal-binding domain-containing protein [Legionella sp. km772]
MAVTTGLSGNEVFCLAKKNYKPGSLVVGNSVHSLGMMRSVGSGLKAMLGGELTQITQLIEEGRETAYKRMLQEAAAHRASGITGVTSQLIVHGSNVEFLSIGSVIHSNNDVESHKFSTSDDGQELYAQLDAGFQPICFSFGNVAYSMGVARGLLGGLKTLGRGEIKEYSDMFNHTRHLALNRISEHAKQYKANAVLGIRTTILPFGGVNEMLMIGTASYNAQLATNGVNEVVTSDMTNIEMWSMANMGYEPVKLLLGTSVFSLGLVGGITSTLKSLFKGEINELTRMIYAARENALGIITDEAKAIGADDIVGVKTYVYQLGNGLVEFLAIGTAVKQSTRIKTQSEQLIPQAIAVDKDTFYDSTSQDSFSVDVNKGTKPINRGSTSFLFPVLIVLFIIINAILHLFK